MTQALLKTAYELANSVLAHYDPVLRRRAGEEEFHSSYPVLSNNECGFKPYPSVHPPSQQPLHQQQQQTGESGVETGVLAIPLRTGRERHARSYWGNIRDLDESFQHDTLYLDTSKISVGALAEFLVDHGAPVHVMALALDALGQLQNGNHNAAFVSLAESEGGSKASRPGSVDSSVNAYSEESDYKPSRKGTVKNFFLRLRWRLGHTSQESSRGSSEGESSEEEEGDKQFRFHPGRLLEDLRVYWYKRRHRRKPAPKAEVYTSESVTSVRKDIRRVPSLWSRTLSYVRLARPVQYLYTTSYYWQ